DRNRSHWSTSKTPSYTKSVSWQHHPDAVSTNYHDRTSYYSDKAIETQYVSSSERTSDVSEDIRLYAHQIKSAIEKQFGDASKYSGKECTLRMHMAPNGLLLEVKRESGDLDLCREAMNAIKNADIPAPPSPEVYKVFQNGVLDFKP
ncbi:cell envelope integrity protein TolA, partial [Escherichia coli]|uniref:cell envelope integrity protein TolA n=2 Tax=Escherichia coli TaxID=562 RepID=UPI001CD95225